MGFDPKKMPKKTLDLTLSVMAVDDVAKLDRKRRCPRAPGLPTPKEDLEGMVLMQCLDLLRGLSITAWRSNTGAVKVDSRYVKFGVAGQADITGLLPNGRRLEVECKRRNGGVQSDAQKDFQRLIESSNGLYLLVHSAGELMDGLKGVLT